MKFTIESKLTLEISDEVIAKTLKNKETKTPEQLCEAMKQAYIEVINEEVVGAIGSKDLLSHDLTVEVK